MSSIKQGYKQTKVGIIPEDWEVVKLNDIFTKSFYGTSESTNEIGKYPVLRMGNMQNGTLIINDLAYIDLEDKEFKKYQLKKGDILLNRTNSYELVGKISLFDLDEDFISASYIVAYRPNQKILNSIFINNLLNTTYFQEKIKTLATKGVSQANINPTAFKEVIKIPLPPLKEQEKIAEILTTWDEAISLHVKLIEEKEQLKIGLMQKLLSGEVRFEGFCDEWEEVNVGKFMIERNIQTPKSDEYPLMAFVAYKGVTDKGDRYDREFLVTDEGNKKYKRTEYGDFIYSSNNLETGSIGLNRYGSATISPVYSIFQITKSCDYKFISNFFVTKKFINNMVRYRQGVMYGQWRIHESDFLKIKVSIPCLKEQQKIAEILSLADDELSLLKKELEELKQQKKGLMQKLLTGEVRVMA